MAEKAVIQEEKKNETDIITDTRQKAAIVVVSLGADRASQIYKYLSEQDLSLIHI